MEIFGVLALLAVVGGPWALAGVALARANRAREEAQRAHAAAHAAWRAARASADTPLPEAGEKPSIMETELAIPPPLPPRPAAEERIPAPPVVAAVPPEILVPQPTRESSAARGPERAALEEKIALVWFTRAGALAILVGAAYFLKYAVDNALLGPWGRIASGCAMGAGALVAGEALRARTRPIWIHGLQGAGIALLFLAGFGSHALYHLVPVAVAFGAVAVVALLGGALAVRHRAELLLAIALVGGLLAPVLLSTGEDRPLALFGYLLVVGGAALLVSSHLGFRVTPWIAFAGAAVLGAGWYARFFDIHAPPAVSSAYLPLDEQVGRYFPLARRLVPLLAAAAFSAAWLGSHPRLRRGAPRVWADAWLSASLVFAHVAPFAVLRDRPFLVAPILAGAGVLAAVLLRRTSRLPFILGAQFVALGLLGVAVDSRQVGPAGPWILAAALVTAAQLGIVAHAWLVRGEAPVRSLTAVAAIAGFAFTGFVLRLTGDEQALLRAALIGAAGASELALGAAMVARARPHASTMLGAALALMAAAAAFLFSGTTITVVWAAMAAIAAVIAARDRDPWWLGGALAMFVAALVRVATIDILAVDRATNLFLDTAGAEGRLAPLFLLNPRAISLAATVLALLVAARAIHRGREDWQAISAIVAAGGWGFAVVLAVTEARDLVFTPPPLAPGDFTAFVDFRHAIAAARSASGERCR
jgi:hypothetical protein